MNGKSYDFALCGPASMKDRVDQFDNFYPDKPGAPRRGAYKTFYDWAPPQNPF